MELGTVAAALAEWPVEMHQELHRGDAAELQRAGRVCPDETRTGPANVGWAKLQAKAGR